VAAKIRIKSLKGEKGQPSGIWSNEKIIFCKTIIKKLIIITNLLHKRHIFLQNKERLEPKALG
jgi:hypothetical protein